MVNEKHRNSGWTGQLTRDTDDICVKDSDVFYVIHQSNCVR